MPARSSSCSPRRRSAGCTGAGTPSCGWPRGRSRTSTSTWPRRAPATASWRSPTPPPATPPTTPRAPPGLYGLDVHELPYDAERMDVDLPRLAVVAAELQPKLIIVGGSMCLHPYDVRGVRAVADEVGAHVLYDAAHMGGLIAGGRFQQPLQEGAHAITGSTYKSFGGPPSGMILTDDPGAGRAPRCDRLPRSDGQLRPGPPGGARACRARPARARRGLRGPPDRERAGTGRGPGRARRAGARRARQGSPPQASTSPCRPPTRTPRPAGWRLPTCWCPRSACRRAVRCGSARRS